MCSEGVNLPTYDRGYQHQTHPYDSKEVIQIESICVQNPESCVFHNPMLITHVSRGCLLAESLRFQRGLVFKAHRLLYHLSLGLRVKEKRRRVLSTTGMRWNLPHGLVAVQMSLYLHISKVEPSSKVDLDSQPAAMLTAACRCLATQGPWWGYSTVNFTETLSFFGDKCPQNGSKNGQMVPRTTLGCPHEGPRVVPCVDLVQLGVLLLGHHLRYLRGIQLVSLGQL